MRGGRACILICRLGKWGADVVWAWADFDYRHVYTARKPNRGSQQRATDSRRERFNRTPSEPEARHER